MKTVFHNNHTVTVDGFMVGTWRAPDPSGTPWARTAVWIFKANDNRVEHSSTRKDLTVHAESAFRRLPVLLKLEPRYNMNLRGEHGR